MTELERKIKSYAQYPMDAPAGNIGRGLRELNEVLERGAQEEELELTVLTDDELKDIEASFLAARAYGSDRVIKEAEERYVEILRKKGVSESLLPSTAI